MRRVLRWSFAIAGLGIAGASLAVVAHAPGHQAHWRGKPDVILALFSTFGIASAPSPDNPAPSVGTNLDGLSYWSTATPFLDLAKSSGAWLPQRSWVWDSGEKLDLDSHGWVRSLPGPDGTNRAAAAGLIVLRGGDPPAHASYALLYDGDGTIEGLQGTRILSVDRKSHRVNLESADNGWLHLKVTSTDPGKTGDYIRNIRIVRDEYLPLFARGEIFNLEFLKTVAPFEAFRFMDWMSTNRLYRSDGTELKVQRGAELNVSNADLLNWRNRPMPEDARWNRGVPVEVMVALANRTGAEPWFNMPINASDDYVRGFASFVHSNLKPGVRVHIELSNEVWNGQFPQAAYAKARARQLYGPGADGMEWYGRRTAEVGAIWNSVFGEPATSDAKHDRVRIVYGTQFVWKGRETAGLETPHWIDASGVHHRAADYFDEYAVTGYYNGGFSKDAAVPAVMASLNAPDRGFPAAIRALSDGIENFVAPLYQYHAGRAKEYGLELVTYESGFGERTPPRQHGNEAYTNFLIDLQRRPEIHDLDMANYAAFRRAGGTLFMNYGIIGKPSKYGSWSALESLGQRSSPRYQALLDMLKNNKAKPAPVRR